MIGERTSCFQTIEGRSRSSGSWERTATPIKRPRNSSISACTEVVRPSSPMAGFGSHFSRLMPTSFTAFGHLVSRGSAPD